MLWLSATTMWQKQSHESMVTKVIYGDQGHIGTLGQYKLNDLQKRGIYFLYIFLEWRYEYIIFLINIQMPYSSVSSNS